jgi:hypothetical protein
MPTFVVHFCGRVVMQRSGVANHEQLEHWLKSAGPVSVDAKTVSNGQSSQQEHLARFLLWLAIPHNSRAMRAPSFRYSFTKVMYILASG